MKIGFILMIHRQLKKCELQAYVVFALNFSLKEFSIRFAFLTALETLLNNMTFPASNVIRFWFQIDNKMSGEMNYMH